MEDGYLMILLNLGIQQNNIATHAETKVVVTELQTLINRTK